MFKNFNTRTKLSVNVGVLVLLCETKISWKIKTVLYGYR